MKVRILNVKYSKNVGDGIIAECIEHFFLQYNTVDIKSVDLSGKKNFSVNKNAKLGKGFIAYKFIDIFPNRVSKFLIERLVPFIMKYKLGSYFKEELSDADVLIIGGGQLFQDKKMYFPPRILSALNNLNRNAVIYVYAVGVAQDWTSVGKDYLQKVLIDKRLKKIFVRDSESKSNLANNFCIYQEQISVAYDPGLLGKMRLSPRCEIIAV